MSRQGGSSVADGYFHISKKEITVTDVLTIVISTVIGAALSFIAVKLLDRLRRRDAETDARIILEHEGRRLSWKKGLA